MTTSNIANPVLIIRHQSGRIIGACDANCYNELGFGRDCICGCVNRGVGRVEAARNVMAGLKINWKATWAKLPQSECKVIIPRGTAAVAYQLQLFETEPEDSQEETPCPQHRHPF